jgi:hypothetical protein
LKTDGCRLAHRHYTYSARVYELCIRRNPLLCTVLYIRIRTSH